MTARRLVLFDIDGTLLSTSGVAGGAMRDAMVEVFGTAGPVDGYPFMGKTDPQIVRELLTGAGLPASAIDARLPDVLARYLELVAARLAPERVRVMPGVRAVLERLAGDDGVVVGLLTGNLERGAELKLQAAGLAHYFRLGAFGSDHADRNCLVPVARARAGALLAAAFAGAATVVVGDAPPDVACARAAGARAVAVATGLTAREELAALAPDALLADLGAVDAAIAAILA